VKPISLERFLTSINRVRSFLDDRLKDKTGVHRWINIKEGRRIYHLHTSEILYLQAYGDYVRVFTREQAIMTKDKLSAFKEQLPVSFIQVHRSFIVNAGVIKFLEGNMLIIRDTKIPVSDSYREELIRFLK
jgi:two-component system, LytTR family, response regulator